MSHWLQYILFTSCVILSIGINYTQAAEKHPQIYADRLDAMRQAVEQSGSHHALCLADMIAAVDKKDDPAVYPEHVEAYRMSYPAREAAFLSFISTDAAAKKKYAQISYDLVKNDFNGVDRVAHEGKGLSRAMMSLGLALSYDWCYEQWTPQQRSAVKGQITKALDAWPKFGHANVSGHMGSNWVAVCRGAELILIIAADEVEARADRYRKVKKDLIKHMETAYGSIGVSQEGIGYTEYGGNFLMRAILAAKSVGDDDLFNAAQKHEWWRWFMYVDANTDFSRKFVQSGVSHTSNYNEGAASLSLALAPQDQLAYAIFWYDSHMGKNRPANTPRFDGTRGARADAMYAYPIGVTPKDPSEDFPAMVADDHGYYFFRNRWKDADDILISMHADTHSHNHAWDKPEVGALNILAFDTRFIGGPGKNGGSKKTDPEHKIFSAFKVDGKYYATEKGAPKQGEAVSFESDKHSGYVVVDGGKQYQALGVDSYQRHLLVDDIGDNQVILSTLDVVSSGKTHAYTWQANIGDEQGDDDVVVKNGSESGLPMFTLSGRNNGMVKGWVVYPRDAKITSGDPLQIQTSSADATVWVVMWVGAGSEPKATVSGEGLSATISVAGKKVHYDNDKNKLLLE